MRNTLHRIQAVVLGIAVAATAAVVVATVPAGAAGSPLDASFYHYSGSLPLARIKPGTVLKTRTVPYHVAGVPLPLKAVQLLYRSTDQIGEPTVNVTSVVRPLLPLGPPKAVAYQSFYDSLNPADEPSVAIAGGTSLGAGIAYAETGVFAPLLLDGFTVIIPDTEGQQADFAAGPEYGKLTLDALRAASHSPVTGLRPTTKVGMLGYSGGAIATEWAAELAPSYAPDVAKRLVGSAAGGVLVEPIHNLHYISGSMLWSGVMPMALIGLSQAFHVDLTPYLSDYGKQVLAELQGASIIDAIGHYPGLTWAKLTKPAYAVPESVPVFVKLANKLIMGTGGTPTSPLFLGQGTGGYLEGTAGNKPGIGAGDGVMVAGDVRSLAREYCARGVTVRYQQYDGLSHVTTVPVWLPQAYTWLLQRFAGKVAPSSCGKIEPGNPLTPLRPVPPGR